jgi:hypothetical protein
MRRRAFMGGKQIKHVPDCSTDPHVGQLVIFSSCQGNVCFVIEQLF